MKISQALDSDTKAGATAPKPSAKKSISRLRNRSKCIPIEAFGQKGAGHVPQLLYQLRSRIVRTFTNENHWSDQIVNALADGYSTRDDMRRLLKRDYNTYTLRECLLVFHWFFKGVTMCDNEPTLEYRLRGLQLRERNKSK